MFKLIFDLTSVFGIISKRPTKPRTLKWNFTRNNNISMGYRWCCCDKAEGNNKIYFYSLTLLAEKCLKYFGKLFKDCRWHWREWNDVCHHVASFDYWMSAIQLIENIFFFAVRKFDIEISSKPSWMDQTTDKFWLMRSNSRRWTMMNWSWCENYTRKKKTSYSIYALRKFIGISKMMKAMPEI